MTITNRLLVSRIVFPGLPREPINRSFPFSSQQSNTIYPFGDSSAQVFSVAGPTLAPVAGHHPTLLAILENLLLRGVERELKRLVLLFAHWMQASGVSFAPLKPHGYWRWPAVTAPMFTP